MSGPMKLDTFSEEIQNAAAAFKAEWIKRNTENPEEYPLVLPEENAGLWYEFFMNFLLNDQI